MYQKKYLRYIERADIWIEYKEWQPAIQLYKKALSYYPNVFEINCRLALAYSCSCSCSSSCKYENFYCEEGILLVQTLSKKFPNKIRDFTIMDSVFNKYQTEPIFLEIQ